MQLNLCIMTTLGLFKKGLYRQTFLNHLFTYAFTHLNKSHIITYNITEFQSKKHEQLSHKFQTAAT